MLLAAGLVAAALAPAAQATEQVKKGGTLTYSFAPEPTALSTIATTVVPTAIASTKIFESLLEYEGPALTPKPGLAQSWTVSPDHLTYTFKLHPGVKWHDGKPFTSADVKFSIEEIVKPYHSRGKIYFSQLKEIETPDPLTVVMKLNQPVPFFLKAFQPSETPMLPKHILEHTDLTKIRQSEFMRHPIGTGPFFLKEWKKGSDIILERNANYWKKGHPYLDRIILRVIPDDNARVVALQNGEIDLAPMNAIPGSSIRLLAHNENLVVSHEGSEGLGPVMGLIANVRNKPLSDLKVREAISLALDRKKIVNVVFYGQGAPATNPIIQANPIFYNKALKPYEFNPAKAKALLDQAGYPVKSDGHRFKLSFASLPYGAAWDRLGEYVRLALGDVGIEVDLRKQDFGGWLRRVYTDWDFDLASTFYHDYSDPSIVLEQEFASWAIQKGGFNNAMGYRNDRIDSLLKQGNTETDVQKRQKIYFEVEQILHDQMPEIFLMDQYYTNVWNKRVHGLITNGVSMYSSWDSVWVE
jgi:peptide/nickel transport system substrate-binding protein